MPHFLGDGCLGGDCDAGVDLDSSFHGFDIVEFHNGFDFDLIFAKNLIDRFTRWNVGVEADEFVVRENVHVGSGVARERVLWMANGDQTVCSEGDYFDLARFDRKRDEAEIDRGVLDVFVDQIRAAIFDANIDGGVVGQKRFDVGRQLVQADTVDRRNANGAADDFLHLHQLARQLFVNVEDFLGCGVHSIAFAGELELLLTAVDEQSVEVLFHGSGLLADGGLGDSVEASGFREALGFYQVCEDLKVIDLHGEMVELKSVLLYLI